MAALEELAEAQLTDLRDSVQAAIDGNDWERATHQLEALLLLSPDDPSAGGLRALLVATAGIPAVATAPPQPPSVQEPSSLSAATTEESPYQRPQRRRRTQSLRRQRPNELNISVIVGGPGKPSDPFLDSRLSQLAEIERRDGPVAARFALK